MTTRGNGGPVDSLLAELSQRAAAEAESRLAVARAEAARIRAAGEARREARRGEALARCDLDAWRSGQPELARATHEARQRVLSARRALVDRVLAEALALLRERAARGAPPDEWLRARVDEVLSYVSGTMVELRCPPAWVVALAPIVGTRPDVRVVGDEAAAAGLTAVEGDGRLTVDDTVESWVRRERAALAIEICAGVEEP